jgi:hypothetical protein
MLLIADCLMHHADAANLFPLAVLLPLFAIVFGDFTNAFGE